MAAPGRAQGTVSRARSWSLAASIGAHPAVHLEPTRIALGGNSMHPPPLVCVITVCLCAGRAASEQPRPIFAVSFDTGLSADAAGGGRRPSVAGSPRLVPGKFGQALCVGAQDQHLLYPLRGNVDPLKGTLSMWVKPVGFAPSQIPKAAGHGFELFRVVIAGDEIKVAMTRSNSVGAGIGSARGAS